jgi:hypothetical protein
MIGALMLFTATYFIKYMTGSFMDDITFSPQTMQLFTRYAMKGFVSYRKYQIYDFEFHEFWDNLTISII